MHRGDASTSTDASRLRPPRHLSLLVAFCLAPLWSSLVVAAVGWSHPKGLLEAFPSAYTPATSRASHRVHSDGTLNLVTSSSRHEKHNRPEANNVLGTFTHTDDDAKFIHSGSSLAGHDAIYRESDTEGFPAIPVRPSHGSLPLALPGTGDTPGTSLGPVSPTGGQRGVPGGREPLHVNGRDSTASGRLGPVRVPVGDVAHSWPKRTRGRRWQVTGEGNGGAQVRSMPSSHPDPPPLPQPPSHSSEGMQRLDASMSPAPPSRTPEDPASRSLMTQDLNPLRLRPASRTKPSPLRFTPLAHPHHPNVSYASPRPSHRHTPPHTPNHASTSTQPRPLYAPHINATVSLPLDAAHNAISLPRPPHHAHTTAVNPAFLLLRSSLHPSATTGMKTAAKPRPTPSLSHLIGHRDPETHEDEDAAPSGFPPSPRPGGGGGGGGGGVTVPPHPRPASFPSLRPSKNPVVPASLLMTLANNSYVLPSEQQQQPPSAPPAALAVPASTHQDAPHYRPATPVSATQAPAAPHPSEDNSDCDNRDCLELNRTPQAEQETEGTTTTQDSSPPPTPLTPAPTPLTPAPTPLTPPPTPLTPPPPPLTPPPTPLTPLPTPHTPAGGNLQYVLLHVLGLLRHTTRVGPPQHGNLTAHFDAVGLARPLVPLYLPWTRPSSHHHAGHHRAPGAGVAPTRRDRYVTLQLNPITRLAPKEESGAATPPRLRGELLQDLRGGAGHGASPGMTPDASLLLNLIKPLNTPDTSPLPTPRPLPLQERQQQQQQQLQQQQQQQQQEQQQRDRRLTLRQVMRAAGFVVPVTTALLAAFGAPVALMAPLGLAIPALLTAGVMGGRSVGPSSRHMQGRAHTSARRHGDIVFGGLRDGDEEAVGVAAWSSGPPSEEVTDRRRRDVTEEGGVASRQNLTGGELRSSPQSVEAPWMTLARQGKTNTSLLLPKEVEVLDSLTWYYQSLSSLGQNAPTLEEISAHRLFLLSLLKKLTNGKSKRDSHENNNSINSSNNNNFTSYENNNSINSSNNNNFTSHENNNSSNSSNNNNFTSHENNNSSNSSNNNNVASHENNNSSNSSNNNNFTSYENNNSSNSSNNTNNNNNNLTSYENNNSSNSSNNNNFMSYENNNSNNSSNNTNTGNNNNNFTSYENKNSNSNNTNTNNNNNFTSIVRRVGFPYDAAEELNATSLTPNAFSRTPEGGDGGSGIYAASKHNTSVPHIPYNDLPPVPLISLSKEAVGSYSGIKKPDIHALFMPQYPPPASVMYPASLPPPSPPHHHHHHLNNGDFQGHSRSSHTSSALAALPLVSASAVPPSALLSSHDRAPAPSDTPPSPPRHPPVPPPTSHLQETHTGLPATPPTRKPLNTALVAEYLSLMEAFSTLRGLNTQESTALINRTPEPKQDIPSNLTSRTDLTPSSSPSRSGLTPSNSPSRTDLTPSNSLSRSELTPLPTPDLYFLDTAAEDASEVAPRVAGALTDLITAIGDAISSFVQAIAEAISTFLQSLATAIEDKPGLLLLALIPLFFLLISLFTTGKLSSGNGYGGMSHGGMSGYGGGMSSYGGRSVSSSPGTLLLDVPTAEALAAHILAQVEAFEERLRSYPLEEFIRT